VQALRFIECADCALMQLCLAILELGSWKLEPFNNNNRQLQNNYNCNCSTDVDTVTAMYSYSYKLHLLSAKTVRSCPPLEQSPSRSGRYVPGLCDMLQQPRANIWTFGAGRPFRSGLIAELTFTTVDHGIGLYIYTRCRYIPYLHVYISNVEVAICSCII
jgi:hypothetical protein